jgi:putative CocE/NonD family hydrolase
VQYLRDWIAHPCYDQYWAVRGVCDRDVTVPNFVVGGWYDIFAKSVFEHVTAVRTTSYSPVARAHQHLLVGPWIHGDGESGKVGDLNFGPLATRKAAHLDEMSVRWFEHWLEGKANEVETWPAYCIFVMGRNQWRDEAEWPPQRAQYIPWYFHSQGGAKTLSGDGQLCAARPGREPVDAFVYDPADPVPTLGGCNLVGCPSGPRDQTSAERRSDVLVFSSVALPEDVEATGPVKVILYAASSAIDTDWTAKLVDVDPKGHAYNLCDGILRARHRISPQTTTFLEPGAIYRYEIDLGVTSNVFLAGHKVRVEISSSNFPRFDRNLNTADAWGTATTPVKATQSIYHDWQHPSRLVLPMIP